MDRVLTTLHQTILVELCLSSFGRRAQRNNNSKDSHDEKSETLLRLQADGTLPSAPAPLSRRHMAAAACANTSEELPTEGPPKFLLSPTSTPHCLILSRLSPATFAMMT